MAEHRLLTGDSLHEPKGADTAIEGSVYMSNGAGSGNWVGRFSGLGVVVTGEIPDISAPNSNFIAAIPFLLDLRAIVVVLYGPITAADATLTLYKNGASQGGPMVIPFTGSAAGSKTVFNFSPIRYNINDVLEIRTDGGSSTSAAASVSFNFVAI